MGKILKRLLKILGWTIGSIIVLLVLVIILIQVPGVQNFARGKAVAFLEKKLNTKVAIDHLSIAFPKKVVLEGIYIEDLKKDTLLAGKKIAIDISMFKLLDKTVEVNDLELDGIRGNVYRVLPDTVFNFDFIVKAFTSPPSDKPKDTTSAAMTIDIDHVKLSNILVTFKDDQSGSDMYLSLGRFETNVKKFDLDKMLFNVPKLDLEKVVARVYQHKPLTTPETDAAVKAESSEPMNLGLEVGTITIKDIDADYGNDVSALKATIKLGELLVKPRIINLNKLDIALKEITLNNTDAAIVMGATEESKAVEEKTEQVAKAQSENPWKITLDKVSFANNNLKFDNNNQPKAAKGIDYGHLDVKGLTIDAKNLQFTPTEYSGDIATIALTEHNFVLKKLQTKFLYNDRGAALENLWLETDKTLLRQEIRVGWTSLASLKDKMGEMMIIADLKDTRIGFADVLTFVPTLATAPPFKGNENAVFKLNTNIKGQLKDLDIPVLQMSGLQATNVDIKGRIRGLPDAAKASYNLSIKNISTTQGDLNRLLPKGSLPPSIQIPERIVLSGLFVGGMNAFNTNLKLATSRGTASVQGMMVGMGKHYNLNVGTSQLDLGYILKQPATLGPVTMNAAVKGSGFDPEKMVADVKAKVISAEAQGYTYQNLDLVAKLNKGNVTAVANMRDPNLKFDLDATAIMKGKFPAVTANLNLDKADLQALNFSKTPLSIHTKLVADMNSTDPDALDGSIRISDLLVSNNGKEYAMYDTMSIDAYAAEGGGRTLEVKSQAIAMNLTGNYKLTEIAPAVQSTINKYYQIPGYKPAPYSSQQWTLNAAIIPSPLLYAFVPNMKGSDSITAAISFNSDANDLKLDMDAEKLVFGTTIIDSLQVDANTTASAFEYGVRLRAAAMPQVKLYQTALTGTIANNQLTTALDVKDIDEKSRYQLAAILNQVPNNGFKVSLQQGLMLNYEVWNVTGDNYIQYDDAGLIINNFNVGNDGQSISANSTALSPTAPIDVQFTNFRINTITTLLKQDSLLADGLINGGAQLRNPTKDLVFTSDLTIADISYLQDTVGTLTVKVNNETAQTLAADIKLSGNGNDISIGGKYFITSKNVDLNLDLNNVNLASIKKFTAGQLTDASGSLKGSMEVKGTLDKPAVDGELHFDQAFITPSVLGERFSLTDERISVNSTGIHFNDFDIADSSNNKATLDGDILTSDFKNYKFNLNLDADNFQAVKATRKPGSNQMFYGRLNLSTNTKVRGTMDLPVITSTVRINKGTDFSYILPTQNPEVQSREGVVEFIDPRHENDSAFFAAAKDSLTAEMAAKGIDFDARLETDSSAKFNVVLDELTNDALHIKGIASLQAGMDRSGKVSLTGNYTLTEGSYLLTLSFLKRQFFVQPGSTITWDGDPTSATVNLTALYTTNTAPIDLMEHQLSGKSQAEINQYKQRLPFTVFLRMRGELLKPTVSFDIGLPEREQTRWRDVEQKLAQIRNDETELNKQVFALLLLNRFIDENPLEGNGGSNVAESFARQSAGRLLTDQLNRLAGGLVPGVDLNFGVNSGDDYSTGQLQQRTDITVGISKRLLNDRLTVSVGSSFQVEGATNNNQQASNIGGDIALNYQLSKDGRYHLRAYRRNDYEGIAVGQVIETGAGFIFTIDYDTFNEFFRGKKKEPARTN